MTMRASISRWSYLKMKIRLMPRMKTMLPVRLGGPGTGRATLDVGGLMNVGELRAVI
jgi:hypothetical protein